MNLKVGKDYCNRSNGVKQKVLSGTSAVSASMTSGGKIAKQFFPTVYRERATPVPIPNTEVKPLFGDGTARVAWWESSATVGFI